MSDEQRDKRQKRQEKEARAIEACRAVNQGDATDVYRCPECGGNRCNQFATNSLGATHATTSVPDMIVECLECGHRFSI